MIRLLKAIISLLKGGFADSQPSKQEPERPATPQLSKSMSENGLTVLKYFESCRLDAYWDSDGGVWTIGWGDTGPDVVKGLRITQRGADIRLENRLRSEFVPGVLSGVKQPDSLTQGQLDAMVDLAYNVGVHAFKNSTLLRKLNAGDIDGASIEFKRWNKAGGKALLGLKRRRAADEALFNGFSGKEAIGKGVAINA